ncbi:hypothetical protein [Spirillospora sp. NPDC047279]|uniref:DUF6907 domain-containing protein n=1 Tax=Spirillospora sp. NPDC047279 TaxID=3155478 RepID=UPI0033C5C647
MNVLACHSIEISVVQHEDAAGHFSDPSVYLGVHSTGEMRIVRLTLESAYLLSHVADDTPRSRAFSDISALLRGAGLGDLQLSKEDAGWVHRFPIALRHVANKIRKCLSTPCPPWCVEDHRAPQDTLHVADGLAVLLSRYPYWANGECCASPVTVGLRQDFDDPAPIVVLSGPDNFTEIDLNLDEAEQLGRHLLEVVDQGRASAGRDLDAVATAELTRS